MSITAVTAWQTVWVFLAYTFIILPLPAIMFAKKLRVMSMPERFIFCVVAGNFWVVTMVLMLTLFHVNNAFTCFMATYGLGFIAMYFRNQKKANAFIRRQALSIQWLARNELRGALYVKRGLWTFWRELLRLLRRSVRWVAPRWMELALLTICFVGNVWFFSYQSLYCYNIGTSDVLVHAQWINAMMDGKLFASGVYPSGYHAIIVYLKTLTGIDTLYMLRVMGTVQSMYIYMMFYLLLRSMCKCKYAAMIGFAVLSLTSAFVDNAMMRYQWALPQEYGMMFLYPMAFYLRKYYEQYRLRTRAELKQERDIRRARRAQSLWKRAKSYFTRASSPRSSTLPLLMFSVCVSLTLSIHFYDTIAAFELAVAVTLVNIPALFKAGCFRRLVCYVLLLVMVAALPMGLALATGTPPENSLNWGLSIVNNYAGTSKEVNENPYNSDVFNVDISVLAVVDKVKAVVRSALYYLQFAVTPHQWYFLSVGMMVFAGSLGAVCILFKRRNFYMQRWFSILLYIIMLIMIVRYPMLGFPALMEGSRASIYISYAIGLLYAMPFDILYCVLTVWKRATRACNALMCAMCCAVMAYSRLPAPDIQMDYGAITPAKSLAPYHHFEYTASILVLYDLISNYPQYTWTFVSPVTETNFVHSHGRHYDLSTFIRQLDKYKPGDELTIPTEYVFFMVEKKPLDYWQVVDMPGNKLEWTEISEAAAIEGFPQGKKLKPLLYCSKYRTQLESKTYYWVQKMMELYPYEMTVYYEDDYVTCYRLKQNTNALYNLAVDYGYNHSVLKRLGVVDE